MTKNIKIDKNIVLNLQRLSAEMESRKSLIAFMISSDMDISTERFIKYQDEYTKYYLEYDIAKTLFEKDILKKEYQLINLKSWNLDFNSYECRCELGDVDEK